MALYPQITDLLDELTAFFPIECSLIRADLEVFASTRVLDEKRSFEEQKAELSRLIELNIARVRQAAVEMRDQLQELGVQDPIFGFYPEHVEGGGGGREVGRDAVQIEPIDVVVSDGALRTIIEFSDVVGSYIETMQYEPPSPGEDPSTDGNPPPIPSRGR